MTPCKRCGFHLTSITFDGLCALCYEETRPSPIPAWLRLYNFLRRALQVRHTRWM